MYSIVPEKAICSFGPPANEITLVQTRQCSLEEIGVIFGDVKPDGSDEAEKPKETLVEN